MNDHFTCICHIVDYDNALQTGPGSFCAAVTETNSPCNRLLLQIDVKRVRRKGRGFSSSNTRVVLPKLLHNEHQFHQMLFLCCAAAWTLLPSRCHNQAAARHSMKLSSDVAFAFGGYNLQHVNLPTADIYTPSQGSTPAMWNNGSNTLSQPTYYNTAVVLADGNILSAGGNKRDNSQPPGLSQILNTTDLSWSATSPMVRQRVSTAAILLTNGSGEYLQSKVLSEV